MSPRTLQRRLQEEGTSHLRVLEGARQHVATHMLASTSLPIAEIADALGFSEPAALHRAFKRWTGMTPVEYRRKAAGDAQGQRARTSSSNAPMVANGALDRPKP